MKTNKIFGHNGIEMVKLCNQYNECEALPKECIVINTL